jgi:hypothetical protein
MTRNDKEQQGMTKNGFMSVFDNSRREGERAIVQEYERASKPFRKELKVHKAVQ